MLSSGCTWDLMIFNSGPNFSLQAITCCPLGHWCKEFPNKSRNSDELTCSLVKINYLTWQLNYTFLFAALQHAKHQPKCKHKVLVCQNSLVDWSCISRACSPPRVVVEMLYLHSQKLNIPSCCVCKLSCYAVVKILYNWIKIYLWILSLGDQS